MTAYPIRYAVRHILHNPSLLLAELVWRWVMGAVSALLIGWTLFNWLDPIHVTNGDLLALSTMFPPFVSMALKDMFRGSGPALVRGIFADVMLLGAVWLVAATAGRMATLPMMRPEVRFDWRGVLSVNLLRAAMAFTAVLAYLGALVLAYIVAGREHFNGANFVLVIMPLWFVISVCWSTVSWYLQ